MFVLLSSSQQLLDILGDLFGLADDVLCAGKRGVRVHLQIIKFRDRATLPQPATVPQPPSPAEPAKWVKKKPKQQIKPPAKTCFFLLNCTWRPLCLTDFWVIFLPRVIHLRVIERVVIVTFWHAALLLQFWSLGGKKEQYERDPVLLTAKPSSNCGENTFSSSKKQKHKTHLCAVPTRNCTATSKWSINK